MKVPFAAGALLLALGAAPAAPDPAPLPPAAPAEDEAPETPGPWVYLVARIKLTGTDFTQVVFFRHRALDSLAACEAERNAGLTTGWTYFSRHYLTTLKGISYKVDYRCAVGAQQLAYWHKGVPLDHFYLVRITDGQLQVTPQRNFFACREALRGLGQEESIDAFCGIASQALLSPAP